MNIDDMALGAAPASLQDLIDNDYDGLLDEPQKSKKVASSDRLERAFLEVVDFRQEHGRAPSSTTREISERRLGARLDGILANDEKMEALKHLDEFGLLETAEPPESLDELLESDVIDDLLGDDGGILDVSDLPVIRKPESPDSVAKRIKADDFDQFEHLFKAKHAELADGTLQLTAFTGLPMIREGAFFVLGGVMCFVAEVGEDVDLVVGGKPQQKQRLRVVFENGTESKMYKQSLMTRMYEQQGQVLARSGVDASEIFDADMESGHVYVLQSLSEDPAISGLKNLHKIGFSTTSVEQRIRSAESSATYLMAPVRIVADYRLYNVKPSTLEHLLHRVFAEVRLDLTQIDRKGRDYDPSEWFIAPRDVVNRAVAMIVSGEIVDYVYDSAHQQLVPRA